MSIVCSRFYLLSRVPRGGFGAKSIGIKNDDTTSKWKLMAIMWHIKT